jgi:hypothetical protein
VRRNTVDDPAGRSQAWGLFRRYAFNCQTLYAIAAAPTALLCGALRSEVMDSKVGCISDDTARAPPIDDGQGPANRAAVVSWHLKNRRRPMLGWIARTRLKTPPKVGDYR